jgi:hypothetical protein
MTWIDDWDNLKRQAIKHRADAEACEQKAARLLLEHGGHAQPSSQPATAAGQGKIICEKCKEEIKDYVQKDKPTWTAAQQAEYSRKNRGGKVLCYKCRK